MRAILVLFMLMCGIGVNAQSVTFQKKPRPAGLEVAQVDSLRMTMNISAQGQEDFAMTVVNRDVRRFTVQMVTAGDASPRRLMVDVQEAVESSTAPGQGRKVSPINGQKYVVEITGDAVSALRESGDSLAPAERTALLRLINVKSDHSMQDVLNGRTMNVGDSIVLDGEALAGFAGLMGNSDLTVSAASVMLRDVTTVDGMRCAVLHMRIRLGGARAQVDMDMTLEGDAVVTEDGMWPLSFVFGGDVDGVTTQMGMELLIDGTMQAARTARYSRP
jgi:hypothetical protein